MNDSQQFEIFKFPQSIGLVIVAIYWLYACKERVEGEGMTWRLERDPSQANPGETVNIGLVDGQVTKLRISKGQALFPNIFANLTPCLGLPE